MRFQRQTISEVVCHCLVRELLLFLVLKLLKIGVNKTTFPLALFGSQSGPLLQGKEYISSVL
jgi:hypothetical protein